MWLVQLCCGILGLLGKLSNHLGLEESTYIVAGALGKMAF